MVESVQAVGHGAEDHREVGCGLGQDAAQRLALQVLEDRGDLLHAPEGTLDHKPVGFAEDRVVGVFPDLDLLLDAVEGSLARLVLLQDDLFERVGLVVFSVDRAVDRALGASPKHVADLIPVDLTGLLL